MHSYCSQQRWCEYPPLSCTPSNGSLSGAFDLCETQSSLNYTYIGRKVIHDYKVSDPE